MASGGDSHPFSSRGGFLFLLKLTQGFAGDPKNITESQDKIYNFIRSYLLENHILGVYKINNKLIFEKTHIRLGNKWNNTSK